MKKYLIFDFDGVLVDSFEYGLKILHTIGHDVTVEQWKAHHDGNVFETPAVPFTETSRADFRKHYFENIEKCQPFFKKSELELLAQNFILCIVSSNRDHSIQKFLDFNGFDCFKEVLGGDFHKSKVEKFTYLFEKYHFSGEDCFYISDTLGDIIEAKKSGIHTLAVDFGFHERARLQQGNPYAIVSSFGELEKVLGNKI